MAVCMAMVTFSSALPSSFVWLWGCSFLLAKSGDLTVAVTFFLTKVASFLLRTYRTAEPKRESIRVESIL